jgi:hypothetical protein
MSRRKSENSGQFSQPEEILPRVEWLAKLRREGRCRNELDWSTHDSDLWLRARPWAYLGTPQRGSPTTGWPIAKTSNEESLDIPHIHPVAMNAKCSYYYIVKQAAPMINWGQDEGSLGEF